MTTALDTNIIVALWDRGEELSSLALAALEECHAQGALVVSAPVYVELMAAPARSETFLNSFFEETGIGVEWELGEDVWRAAGHAFAAHAARRRKQKDGSPRRILADFLIGAHAKIRTQRLLTLDDQFYKKAFPSLEVVSL